MSASAEPAGVTARGVAEWLSLAAAPTFAIMAGVTAVGGAPQMLCAPTQRDSLLGGMVPMYLLMAAFHSTPWLKLVANLRSRDCRS